MPLPAGDWEREIFLKLQSPPPQLSVTIIKIQGFWWRSQETESGDSTIKIYTEIPTDLLVIFNLSAA
ncbi:MULTISPECIES: hypothetical protein [Cyanophyceae]|uniref:hypothetical protein n=1 Tax=Cyanophyceae TaxID=3028117 RepID=UPI0016832EAD|nr:hypothetical protein [Trichocoleus sp. FACHB-832]MBD1907043.1 hypothetical protein [Trichocoleus sp. FACHB-832]